MQLELHFTAPVRDICIINTFHEYCPAVCVVFGRSWGFGVCLWVEKFGCVTVDERAEDLNAFEAFLVVWWCHVLCRMLGLLSLMLMMKFSSRKL